MELLPSWRRHSAKNLKSFSTTNSIQDQDALILHGLDSYLLIITSSLWKSLLFFLYFNFIVSEVNEEDR